MEGTYSVMSRCRGSRRHQASVIVRRNDVRTKPLGLGEVYRVFTEQNILTIFLYILDLRGFQR